jgi:hypothetical protein
VNEHFSSDDLLQLCPVHPLRLHRLAFSVFTLSLYFWRNTFCLLMRRTTNFLGQEYLLTSKDSCWFSSYYFCNSSSSVLCTPGSIPCALLHRGWVLWPWFVGGHIADARAVCACEAGPEDQGQCQGVHVLLLIDGSIVLNSQELQRLDAFCVLNSWWLILSLQELSVSMIFCVLWNLISSLVYYYVFCDVD